MPRPTVGQLTTDIHIMHVMVVVKCVSQMCLAVLVDSEIFFCWSKFDVALLYSLA